MSKGEGEKSDFKVRKAKRRRERRRRMSRRREGKRKRILEVKVKLTAMPFEYPETVVFKVYSLWTSNT